MDTSPIQIERRIRALQSRADITRAHGQDAQPIEDEIAALKAQLRAADVAERRDVKEMR